MTSLALMTFACASACRVERISIALEPIDRRYDIRSLECPSCRSIVRLVEHRMSNSTPCMPKSKARSGFATFIMVIISNSPTALVLMSLALVSNVAVFFLRIYYPVPYHLHILAGTWRR